MTADRPTLKSLSARLDALTGQVEKVQETETEARVISRCVRALDTIPQRTVASYNYGSRTETAPDGTAIGRVLDYLRQRYGLPDPSTEARNLAADLERSQQRCMELEHRLNNVRGAVEVQHS